NPKPGSALGVHDEGANLIRLRGRRDVGHVVAAPFGSIPLDELARWIPRLALKVGRRAVVQNAPVGRPGERPFEIGPGVVWVARIAAGHVVARLVEAAGINPAAACRRAVVAQLPEASHLFAL